MVSELHCIQRNIEIESFFKGLPLIKQANADILFHVLADDDKPDEKEQQDEQKKAVRYG